MTDRYKMDLRIKANAADANKLMKDRISFQLADPVTLGGLPVDQPLLGSTNGPCERIATQRDRASIFRMAGAGTGNSW